jgi:hypothetical protein
LYVRIKYGAISHGQEIRNLQTHHNQPHGDHANCVPTRYTTFITYIAIIIFLRNSLFYHPMMTYLKNYTLSSISANNILQPALELFFTIDTESLEAELLRTFIM